MSEQENAPRSDAAPGSDGLKEVKNPPAEPPDADYPPEADATRKRRRLLGSLALLFIAAGVVWFGYWLTVLRFEESTDNAYVAGNQVRVSALVGGDITEILVDNTDAVVTGQILVRLDTADADLALERARAALANTVRQTARLMIENRRLESLVEQRRREMEKAEGDFVRRRDRKTAMAVSEEEMSHARENFAIAGVVLRVAEEELRANRSLLLDGPLAGQPQVRIASEQVREAWLARKRCEIRSPVTGQVARRTAQPGMHVTPGLSLMAVIPLHDLWVDANFKEVQLSRMRIGQKATVRSDIYGRAAAYHGRVVGFSAGTGSSFSLLPPENATGNWIKVVQRVPVKISLDEAALADAPLLVGLSCTVTVDVSDEAGPMLSSSAPDEQTRLKTTALEHDQTEIEDEIRRIIQENSAAD